MEHQKLKSGSGLASLWPHTSRVQAAARDSCSSQVLQAQQLSRVENLLPAQQQRARLQISHRWPDLRSWGDPPASSCSVLRQGAA